MAVRDPTRQYSRSFFACTGWSSRGWSGPSPLSPCPGLSQRDCPGVRPGGLAGGFVRAWRAFSVAAVFRPLVFFFGCVLPDDVGRCLPILPTCLSLRPARSVSSRGRWWFCGWRSGRLCGSCGWFSPAGRRGPAAGWSACRTTWQPPLAGRGASQSSAERADEQLTFRDQVLSALVGPCAAPPTAWIVVDVAPRVRASAVQKRMHAARH